MRGARLAGACALAGCFGGRRALRRSGVERQGCRIRCIPRYPGGGAVRGLVVCSERGSAGGLDRHARGPMARRVGSGGAGRRRRCLRRARARRGAVRDGQLRQWGGGFGTGEGRGPAGGRATAAPNGRAAFLRARLERGRIGGSASGAGQSAAEVGGAKRPPRCPLPSYPPHLRMDPGVRSSL